MKLADSGLLRCASYIDGRWVDGAETFTVTNPADGSTVGTVPSHGAREATQAVEAAHRAMQEWKGRTAKERAGVLRAWYDLMMQHQEDLAQIMTAEQGKPLAQSRGEIA